MPKPLDKNIVRQRVRDGGFELLSEYTKTQDKHLVRCLTCGEEHWKRLSNALSGKVGCPSCLSDSSKLNIEDVRERVRNSGFELLSEYTGKSNSHLLRCLSCGNEHWKTLVNALYNRGGCSNCAGNAKLSTESARERVRSGGFDLMSDYTKSVDNHLIQCLSCGFEEWKPIGHFLKGKGGCSKCAINVKHSINSVKEYCAKFGYKVVSTEYVNANSRIKIECKLCEKVWAITFNDFQQGKRCPNCAGRNRTGSYNRKTLERNYDKWSAIESNFYIASYWCTASNKRLFKYGVGKKNRIMEHRSRGAEIVLEIPCSLAEAVETELSIKQVTTKAPWVTKNNYPLRSGHTEVYEPTGEMITHTIGGKGYELPI